ncbi:MAG TPA: DUF3857 domain-containing protein [Chitinophagaceae bacterium]|nr:DUF3857 domain-containing protein [Chitinophagaceae bacterium]
MATHNLYARIGSVFVLTLLSILAIAQDKSSAKFGNITSRDFDVPKYGASDSGTGAIILADIGSTTFVGNDYNWLSHIFKRYTRIKILNQNGYDAATQKIWLYSKEQSAEQLTDVAAVTYNIENGKIVETKLDKKDIFEDGQTKNFVEKKFTLPGVKAGSIIEVNYTIKSDFDFRLHDWEFQSTIYPCLWSEYQVSIPNLLIYASVKQGTDSFYISKSWQTNESYSIGEQSDNQILIRPPGKILNTTVNNHRWVMRNIAPIKIESYLSSPLNYIDKIEFQLYQVSNSQETTDVVTNWETLVNQLLTDNNFGHTIDKEPYWLKDKLNELSTGAQDQLEFAKLAFTYFRDNFNCTDHNHFFVKTSLKDVFSNHNGNAGELNLLLMIMLRQYNIAADPVLLSTRDHGFSPSSYPVIDKYNYLICKAKIGEPTYYLDCSHPQLGFGFLPPECYNGEARIVTTAVPNSIILSADSVREQNTTFISINNTGDGRLSAACTMVPGMFQSYRIREAVAGAKNNQYKELLKGYLPVETQTTDIVVDSVKNTGMPVTIKYNFAINTNDAETFYFNPFATVINKNPFTTEKREYPVEMPSCTQNVYILNMEIPAGYQIDELPKSVRIKLGESDGYFEYIAVAANNHVRIRCTTIINRANFDAGYYQTLRDFFTFIVKKESEQIVFKKH